MTACVRRCDTRVMSGHRPGARLLPLAAASAAPALYALWVRPRLLTCGATRDETTCAYPGDELVPDADSTSTMATTLPAPPETVWPWLVQMGADRGGWYSWDWLDHYGEPSAERIVPEWQNLEKGQRLNAARNGQSWFTVAVLDTRSSPLPRAYMDGIWGFHLRPASGDRTRLVVRTRGRGRPRPFTRPFDLLLGEPSHFIMQTRQFHNLRTRVGAKA